MGSNSRVTIVVRTEGVRPRLLSRALDSLSAQTHQALEVVVVHDGGAEVEAGCCEQVSRAAVKALYLPVVKCGRCAAGNAGVEAATGDYVGFLDDDDELLPGHVATLAQVLDDNTRAVGVYALARERVADEGGRVAFRPAPRDRVGVTPFSRVRLWIANYLTVQSVLVRRQALLDVKGFDTNLSALEDWDLWLRLTEQGTFLGINEVTSIFAIPADRKTLERRALDHDRALAALEAKHADLTSSFGFGEIRELKRIMNDEMDDWIGGRRAAARVFRRIRDGR